ncbi:MAG: hypothetical protein ACLFVG_10080 [Candidatus Aminicenantes bacterium]
MMAFKNSSGKVIPILLVVLVLLILAFAGGYFLALVRFDQKYNRIEEKFSAFESKYEKVLTSLRSGQMEIRAYIKEKEGKAKQETNRLRMMGILLKAKGETISSKISLSRDDTKTALDHVDSAISILRDAFELAQGDTRDKIEDIRLRLATVKGIIELDSFKAQKELDKLWREIDALTEE